MYVPTTAKWDAASHQWVASLTNYNFWLYYQAGKTSIDADTLLRVSWLGFMPDNSDPHLQVMATAVQAIQEATLEGPISAIEAYSCNPHFLHSIQDSQQVICMSIED